MVQVVSKRSGSNYEWKPGDVYVGRGQGSLWGNPYELNEDGSNREEVIAMYRRWISVRPQTVEALRRKKPKRLVCWCAPQACHADILKEILEAGEY